MAFDIAPVSGNGGQGSITVTVNSAQAVAQLNILQARILNLGTTVASASNRMNASFASTSKMIQQVVTSLAGLYGIKKIIDLFQGLISKIVEVNRVYTGFIASMSVIKGSLAGARQEYEFLYAMSNKLGVGIENSITQYHRLAASLKNVDKTGQLTRHIFTSLSEAAVVLHSRGRDVQLIFEAVQQMASKGKLSLEELQRQLGNTLPGAFAIAARGMMQSQSFIDAGVTTAVEAERKLRQGIEKGTINVYEFLARLSQQLKVEYGSGVEYASKQFTASFTRMKNALWDFYRTAGDAGAIAGLNSLISNITALLTGDSATSIGGSLGILFENMAKWVKNLDASDVVNFAAAIGTAFTSIKPIMDGFMGAFEGFGSAEIRNPMLGFVEFVATTMAALVDVFRIAMAGVVSTVRGFMDVFYQAREGIGNVNALAMEGQVALGLDTQDNLDAYNAKRKKNTEEYGANKGAMNKATDTFLYGPSEGTAYDKVRDQFEGASQAADYRTFQGGLDKIASYSGVGQPKKQPFQVAPNLNKLPAFLSPGTEIGTTQSYVDPMSPAGIDAMIAQIQANSGAPNGPKTPKAKKAPADTSQNAYLKETTRLLKGAAESDNEYQNVLANRNRSEGEHVAQMKSLITSDERYVKLSQEKKDKLISLAQAWDDANRMVQNAIKAQEAYNGAIQAGFDVQDRLNELRTTGFENQYRELASMANSFKAGGENEFMDQANKQKMLAASLRKDNDQRILDAERYSQSVRQQSDDMMFQADLQNKSALDQQRMTEYRKIDLDVARLSVGASAEQVVQYRLMAEVLKGEVSEALDYVSAKQQDAFSGIMGSMYKYTDEVNNRASEWGSLATNTIGGLEDALISFTETGKLSFSDLAQSMAKDLLKLIVRYQMLLLLQMLTNTMSKSGVSREASPALDTSMRGIGTGGTIDVPTITPSGFAKGGVFTNSIVSQPTMFASGGMFGQMGEKGPEAIMPLTRNSSGQLGVHTSGSGGGDSELNLTVIVYQGEGNGMKSQKEQGPEGDILKIFLGEVSADIQRGGVVGKSINTTYGLKKTAKSYT